MPPMRDRLIPKAVDSICPMDLYGQDAELYLLSRMLRHLDRRTMIDVGAERGGMAEGMLRAGAKSLYALDVDPIPITRAPQPAVARSCVRPTNIMSLWRC
jgi:hypothetical protein